MLTPRGGAGARVVLLLLQPDFGSSTLLLAITAGMLVLGGVNLPRMSMPIVFGLVAMSALAIIEPYRMRRITSFWDPWADQQGDGYQLSNALMAVGRGEWTGVGLGNSVQKLYYLPEAHTDFIFSVTAEELGFVGTCLIVALYALLAGRAFWIGMRCVEMKRHFSGYIAFGIGLWVSMQSFVSIGVNLGILPTKGLTLPLISSGGSSILMTCVAMGLLLRVSYELDRAERRQAVRMGAAELDDAAPVDAPARASAVAAAMQESSARASAQRDSAPRGTSRMQQRIEPTLGRMG
jgi:cell division protein FtsW